jgi:membrane fusion protein (multidrug efflux system)
MKPSTFSSRSVVLLAVVAVGIALLAVWAVRLNDRSPQPRPAAGPVLVETVKATTTDLQDVVTAVGTLRAAESVVIKSEISGRISNVSFIDGARVNKGDALIAFDAAVQQAQLDQAKAEHDLTMAKLNRTRELFEKKFLSAAALDDALASERIALARLALARANLEKMSIRAPFSGIIGIRQVSPGDVVKEGTELINLEDVSAMKADFRVPEQVSGKLKAGQTVQLESDAFTGASFPAQVTAVDATVDAAGRSLLIRAQLKDVSSRLKPGMFVRVRLVVDTRQAAVVIPEEAIVTLQGRLLVFKIVDGNAVSTPITTGLRTLVKGRAMVEVRQGIAAGDQVVTAGQIKIRGNNVPVKVSESARADL